MSKTNDARPTTQEDTTMSKTNDATTPIAFWSVVQTCDGETLPWPGVFRTEAEAIAAVEAYERELVRCEDEAIGADGAHESDYEPLVWFVDEETSEHGAVRWCQERDLPDDYLADYPCDCRFVPESGRYCLVRHTIR